MKEGFLIGGGLIIAGLMLELSAGPVDWDSFRWPVNGIVLAGFLALIAAIFLLRKKVYGFQFIGTYNAAIPALVYAIVLTIIMETYDDGLPCACCSSRLCSCRCVGGASITCPRLRAPACMYIACSLSLGGDTSW